MARKQQTRYVQSGNFKNIGETQTNRIALAPATRHQTCIAPAQGNAARKRDSKVTRKPCADSPVRLPDKSSGKVNRRSRSTIEGTGTNTTIPHKEQVLWHIEKMAGKTPGVFEYRKMISQ